MPKSRVHGAKELTSCGDIQPSVVQVDPGDPSLGVARIELWLTSLPSVTENVNLGGVRSAGFTCEIRSVPIDDDTWLPVEWGTVLADPVDLVLSAAQVEEL